MVRVLLLIALFAGVLMLVTGAPVHADEAPTPTSAQSGTALPWPPHQITLPITGALVSGPVLTSADGRTFPSTGPDEVTATAVTLHPPYLETGTYRVSWTDGAGAHQQALEVGDGTGEVVPLPVRVAAVTHSDPVMSWWWPAVGVLAVLILGGGAYLVISRRRVIPAAGAAGVSLLVVATGILLAPSDLSPARAPSPTLAACKAAPDPILQGTCLAQILVVAHDTGGVPAMVHEMDVMDHDPQLAAGNGEHPCHLAAHIAGRALVTPAADLAGQLAGDTGVCSMGFLHGTVESYGRQSTDQQAVAELTELCPRISERYVSYPKFRQECNHGVGHALAFRFNGDPARGVPACQRIGDPVGRIECVSAFSMTAGVIVNNVRSRNLPVDQWLPAELGTMPLHVCATMPDQDAKACFVGMGQFARTGDRSETLRRIGEAATFCGTLTGDMARTCAIAVGQNGVDVSSGVGASEQARVCQLLVDDPARVDCLAGVQMGRMAGGATSLYDPALAADACTGLDLADRRLCPVDGQALADIYNRLVYQSDSSAASVS